MSAFIMRTCSGCAARWIAAPGEVCDLCGAEAIECGETERAIRAARADAQRHPTPLAFDRRHCAWDLERMRARIATIEAEHRAEERRRSNGNAGDGRYGARQRPDLRGPREAA